MPQPLELQFSDGAAEAFDANGPVLASGDMGPDVKAFLGFRNLRRVEAGELAISTPVRRRWWERLFGALFSRNTFQDFKLTIPSQLTYQYPPVSDHPSGALQRQVYDGELELSWTHTRRLFFFTLRSDRTAPIQSRVTLAYPPDPNAAIDGSMDGQLLNPLLSTLPADSHVTASFASAIPVQYTDPTTFAVEQLVLRGFWI